MKSEEHKSIFECIYDLQIALLQIVETGQKC